MSAKLYKIYDVTKHFATFLYLYVSFSINSSEVLPDNP